jgi:putative spermidine/putrescine transport system permease protein
MERSALFQKQRGIRTTMEARLAIGDRRLGFFPWIGAKVNRYRWLPILPVLIYLLFFFVIPLSRALYGSFWDPDFSLKHYSHFFTRPVYVKVVLNSFRIAVSVTFFSLVLGYPYAYLLSGLRERTANKLLIFVVLPFWVSLLVRNYAWMVLLGRNGVFNSVLMGIGFIDRPVKLIYNSTGVNIGMVHIMLPYMILSLYAVMRGIDRSLLKAAQSLGANPFRTFLRIFLPLSLPGVGGGCLMVFIMAIGFFITPALLGGPRDTMIAQLIEQHVTLLLNWGFAFAAAFILLMFTIVVLLVYNRYLGLDRLWGGIED